jgi:hypothetical protein
MATKAAQVESALSGFLDQSGNPLNNGFLRVFQAGTTTPATTYQDIDKTLPHPFPIPLDSNGQALVYVDGVVKFELYDKFDVLVPGAVYDNLQYFFIAEEINTVTTIQAANSTGISIIDDGGNLGIKIIDGGNLGVNELLPETRFQVTDNGADSYSNSINFAPLDSDIVNFKNNDALANFTSLMLEAGSGNPGLVRLVSIKESTDETNFAVQLKDASDPNNTVEQLLLTSEGDLNIGNNITLGGTVDGRDIAADGATLDSLSGSGLEDLTAAEVNQLKNIDLVTISNTQWGYLGELDQALKTTDNVTFFDINANDINANDIGGNDITANSLISDIINEKTLDAGVIVDGVLIKDGLVDGRDVSVDGATLDSLSGSGLENLTAAEVAQLQNIDLVTISNTQWGYLGSTDQSLSITDNVTFNDVTASNSIITDLINENSLNNGVSIDGVLLKDDTIFVDTITEQSLNSGVNIEGILLKDSDITSNRINASFNEDYVARITQLDTSLTNGSYTVEIDSSAQTGNTVNSGAFNIDVNSGSAFTVNGQGKVGIQCQIPAFNLDIGPGSSGNFVTIPDYEARIGGDTEGQEVAWSLSVNEGTNDRRVKLFLDDDTGEYGFDTNALSGAPDFTIKSINTTNLNLNKDGVFDLPKQHRVLVRPSAAQAISTATNTAVNFDTVQYDIGTLKLAANDRLTIVESGVYWVKASIRYQASTIGLRILWILVNGVTKEFEEIINGTDVPENLDVNGVLYLNSGDYIQAYTYQDAGFNLNIEEIDAGTFFNVVKLY